MKIAFCTDYQTFKKNKIFQFKVAKNYPGTSWLPVFAKLAKQKNHEVATGDIAIENVQAGRWNPSEILIIQDLDAKDGSILAKLGAKTHILMGLEAPLYAYNFYRNIKKIVPRFRHRILYSGFFEVAKSRWGFNYPAYFPSYQKKDILPLKKWAKRKFLVMVAANKYYQKTFPVRLPHYLTEHFDYLRDKLIIWRSPIRKKAINNELISKRLEAIEYFGSKKNLFSLFGANWHDLNNLPRKWSTRLEKPISQLKPKTVSDKIKTISNYKFAICFENTSFPGYVTEKIIDCFVAGVIPIYLGAPNITKFVTADSFIDMRNFSSFGDLHKYLANISEKEALAIISKGRNFLYSPEGKLHSHEGMAKFILNLTTSFPPPV